MRKMIVTDLDGTLLDSNRECPDMNIKYLKQLKEKGYVIVVATGRILDSAIRVTKGAVFADYIISNNGALIYDVNTKKEVYKKTLDLKPLRKICSYYDKTIVNGIDFCNSYYYNKYSDNEHDGHSNTKMIDNIEDFLHDTKDILHATLLFNNDEDVDKIYEKLKKEVPEFDYLIMYELYRPVRIIEVSSKGINKYTAIKILSDLEKIDNNNIIAFGDNANDLEMINNCGTGVAMKNASPKLKDVADYITLSNNDYGIIHFMENIEKKLEAKQYKDRVQNLPTDYRNVMLRIQTYMASFNSVEESDLYDVLTILEGAVENNLKLEDVVGRNIEKFCDEIINNPNKNVSRKK